MVKKSLVWLYSFTTYLLWAVVIVVASVVLSLRYYVLPHAKDYRESIAQYASQTLGQRITISDIEAGWDGMHPYLDLIKVDIYDAQKRPALYLDRVETSLSWLSLVLGEPRLDKLVVHQPNLLIRRAPDGAIFVAGISLNEPGASDFPNWLLRQSNITVENATVVWQDDLRQAPPLALNNLVLNISSPQWESLLGHHRFALRATPSAGASAPIDLRGNLWGKNVDDPKQWRGTLYAKLEGTDIAAWHTWVDYPFDLTQGFGATQFWLNFTKGQAEKVTADVLLANVRTRFGKDMPEINLQSLSGRLGWQRLADGQELRGERLKFATADGFGMKQGQLRVANHERNGKESLEGEASLDELNLEPFAAFAANLPLGKELQDQLAGLAPKGRLQRTKFTWQGDHSAIREYSLRSHFSGLGISPTHGIPGFSGLTGDLDATERGGNISIDSQNALLDLKGVLRWPIPADKLTGKVKWKNSNGATEVQVSELAIASQHLKGTLKASYHYDGKKGGYLDLNGKFGNANGKFAQFYYPLILGKDTLEWLDTSILNARGENVNVVIKGYLDDFPYPNDKDGEFKVSARITDGLLDYADGWPKIEGLQLDMLFHGDRMDLAVDQGRIYGGQITKAKVSIPSLDADHPVLLIQGEVQAPATDTLKFVNTSPVIEAIDHFTDGMKATGSGKMQLDINLPIDDPDATRVKGSYTVSNGTLTGDADFPPLDHVNGKLVFTESSLHAQNVNANIYGGPAQFNLETGTNGLVKVLANGRIEETGLRQAFNHPLMQKVHGATDWKADINLRNHLTNISVHSQLVGLSVSLPPPFSKAAADSVPLRFELQQKNATQETLGVGYGNVVSMKLLRTVNNDVQTVERGEVNFGGNAELPAEHGIFVNGKLAHLDLDLWNELLDKSAGASQDMGNVEIAGANLDIGTLDIFGRRINNLNLAAKAAADGWMTSLQSKEITGDVRWQRTGKGKLLARLKSLTIPGTAPAKMSSPDDTDKTQEYPALDIIAENFEAKEKKLGRLELLANQQGNDWSIDKLKISNADSTLNLDGEWRSWKRKPNTNLNLNWEIDDLGKTLDRFGYPNTVKGGSASLSGHLKWPGSPHEFSLPALGGNLQLEAKRGQFLKIQPGVGRLLGVLSLQALPRRLLFDFRDVFNEGFAFDKISGGVQINQGVMKSTDFKMEGPAAKVAISGETDLDRETLNLHVKVSPSISDTLSLAALAGGPAVGAAAFVAQKLLKDPFNKLVSYQYDIGGTWDDPQELKSSAEKKESPAQTPLGK